MPRIPIEDNFNDVLAKAQRGHGLDDDVIAQPGLLEAHLRYLPVRLRPRPSPRLLPTEP